MLDLKAGIMIFHEPVKCEHCDYIIYGKPKTSAMRIMESHIEAKHVLKHCENCDFENMSIVKVSRHKG